MWRLNGWLCLLLGLGLGAQRAAAETGSPGTLSAPPKRARVVVAEDSGAMVAFQPRRQPIESLVRRGLLRFTGKTTVKDAWLSLVTTQDVVGIKVVATPGPVTGTRLPVVAALVEGLLEAGLTPRQVIVWDKHLSNLRQAGFFELAEKYGVRVAGSAEAGYDENTYYDSFLLGRLIWGDVEFGRKGDTVGRRSYVSRLVTREMTRIVSVPPLLNHNLLGVHGHLYSLAFGSIDNSLRFENNADQLAAAVPEVFALPAIGDRIAFCLTDALVAQYFGEEQSLLHYSTPLQQLWFSTDPLALDVLAARELENRRQTSNAPRAKPRQDLFENAALLELGVAEIPRIDVETVR
jgi:hypothetical protein